MALLPLFQQALVRSGLGKRLEIGS